jgi:hypothetical protein
MCKLNTQCKAKKVLKHSNFTISQKKSLNLTMSKLPNNQFHKHIQHAHCKAQALLKDLNPSLKKDIDLMQYQSAYTHNPPQVPSS